MLSQRQVHLRILIASPHHILDAARNTSTKTQNTVSIVFVLGSASLRAWRRRVVGAASGVVALRRAPVIVDGYVGVEAQRILQKAISASRVEFGLGAGRNVTSIVQAPANGEAQRSREEIHSSIQCATASAHCHLVSAFRHPRRRVSGIIS